VEITCCYARAYYVVAERGDADRDFQSRVFVKTNLPAVLRHELGRPSWAGELVALGTATDCYQPAEARYRLTRAAVEALAERGNPMSLVTKAPLVLRDLDLLSALARVTTVRVFFTVTTVDRALWRQVEPGTPDPRHRLAAVRRLNEAGVPAGVLLAPILPGITDSEAAIEAVVAAAAEHGAVFCGAATLRLPPVVKEHYLGFVGEQFPELAARYARAYPGTYAPREYLTRIDERVERIRARHGFGDGSMHKRYTAPPASRGTGPTRERGGPAPRQLRLLLE
jgi:DNA repair photolyase